MSIVLGGEVVVLIQQIYDMRYYVLMKNNAYWKHILTSKIVYEMLDKKSRYKIGGFNMITTILKSSHSRCWKIEKNKLN